MSVLISRVCFGDSRRLIGLVERAAEVVEAHDPEQPLFMYMAFQVSL